MLNRALELRLPRLRGPGASADENGVTSGDEADAVFLGTAHGLPVYITYRLATDVT